jgi:5-oxoprolinase (ATP-hydrolysing) subunit A
MDLKQLKIDLNADVGEGIENEAFIMPFISSCNIACGGHAGNEETSLKVLKLAKKHHVKVGAHPAFPDKENFGRVKIEMPREELFKSLKHQVNTLINLAEKVGCNVFHLKPHGALYNLAVNEFYYAEIIIDVILDINPNLKLYAPYKSVVAQLAKKSGVGVIFEGFADRNYNNDLTLVNRAQLDAVIVNPEKICNRVLKMITEHEVETISGLLKPIKVNTICVHGDTDNAIEILRQLHEFLMSKNIKIGTV